MSPTRNLGESLLATLPPGVLADFHAAGVLGLADVHTARGLGRIVGETDETVLLAAALTVRALRLGSVCLELERQRDDVFDTGEEAVDASDLTWPDLDTWIAACTRSRMIAVGAEAAGGRPLRWVDGLLYLERYWQQEELLRRQLQERGQAEPPTVDQGGLAARPGTPVPR